MNNQKQINDSSIKDLQQSFDQFNRISASLDADMKQLNRTAALIQNPKLVAIDRPNSADQQPPKHPKALNNQSNAWHLRALIDAIPGGVIVLDPQGIVVEVNASAAELLGDNATQQPWRSIVQQVFLPELDQGELKTTDGHQYSISTRPLGYAPGQILLLSEVTQTRQLQRAAQQNRHLMTMGKMMASLAHQIRTPLSSSMLYLSELVDSQQHAQDHQSFSEKALAQIKHIEKIINDMLVFSHGGQFNMSQFSVGTLLAELEQQLTPMLAQKTASLAISPHYQTLKLQGNKDALLAALGNLCMNALDALDQQSPVIKITLNPTNKGQLQILVDDRGCGMNKQKRDHLFDPFFTTKIDGTGLGLAVVKSVIESHEGKISVASRPKVGTRFRITLPYLQGMKSQMSDAQHIN